MGSLPECKKNRYIWNTEHLMLLNVHLPQIHFTVRILGRIKKQSLKKKTCQISVWLLKISAQKFQDSLIWGADNWFIFYFEEFVDVMLLQSGEKRIYLDLFLNVKHHSSWWGSPLALTRWQYDPKGSSSLAQWKGLFSLEAVWERQRAKAAC